MSLGLPRRCHRATRVFDVGRSVLTFGLITVSDSNVISPKSRRYLNLMRRYRLNTQIMQISQLLLLLLLFFCCFFFVFLSFAVVVFVVVFCCCCFCCCFLLLFFVVVFCCCYCTTWDNGLTRIHIHTYTPLFLCANQALSQIPSHGKKNRLAALFSLK